MKGEALVRRLRGEARRRVLGAKRELTRPWREGRPGTAAEIGRWLGLGAALAAFVAGVGAGLRATKGDRDA